MGGYIMQNLGGFMCFTFSIDEPHILVSYFFGHDPVNNQHKMICSTSVHSKLLKDVRSEHWVFVLKPGGGSWKKVAPDICPHKPGLQGVCIDGVIYYPGRIDTDNYVIVSFHIRSEEFKTIQEPFCRLSEKLKNLSPNLSLIDCGGKLTILNLANLRDKGVLGLFVLEDAKNMEWSRKTLVLQTSQLHLVNNTKLYVRGTTQNGKLLLISKELISPLHILCYDMQSNDMRKIQIKGIPDHWFRKDKAKKRFDLMFMDQSESVLHLET